MENVDIVRQGTLKKTMEMLRYGNTIRMKVDSLGRIFFVEMCLERETNPVPPGGRGQARKRGIEILEGRGTSILVPTSSLVSAHLPNSTTFTETYHSEYGLKYQGNRACEVILGGV